MSEIESSFVRLQITERAERLLALQDRWDRVRQAIVGRSTGDYAAMMRTGIVCRKLRRIGSGKDAHLVEEYEIDGGAVEALNAIERRAAIETGPEFDRQDIKPNGKVSDKAAIMARTFSIEELEHIEARLLAAAAEMEQKPAAAVESQKVVEAPIAGPEPGKLPVRLGSATTTGTQRLSPAAPEKPIAAEGAAVSSVPAVRRSWMD
jgi:hypothetical protein